MEDSVQYATTGLKQSCASPVKVYILVTACTYLPSVQFPKPLPGKDSDPRNYTFLIPNNTCIVGGFKGTETSLIQHQMRLFSLEPDLLEDLVLLSTLRKDVTCLLRD